MAKRKPIVNLDDLKLRDHGNGESFQARIGGIAESIGARMLGCNMVLLAPGQKAWPYHLHHVNEELFVILAGEGTLRYDGKEYPVRQGDVIGAPPGPSSAHQIINTSDGELRYLAISTKESAEIAEYPDTGKIGLKAIDRENCDCKEPDSVFWRLLEGDAKADYWRGES